MIKNNIVIIQNKISLFCLSLFLFRVPVEMETPSFETSFFSELTEWTCFNSTPHKWQNLAVGSWSVVLQFRHLIF